MHCPDIKCKKPVSVDTLKCLLTEKMMNLFYERTFKHHTETNKDMAYCLTPDCKYVFIFDDKDKEFKCPECAKHYCLKCKYPFHKGQTCKEYEVHNTVTEADRKFLRYVRRRGFKQCYECEFWVAKTYGCNHMTCRCGYEFCYKCNEDWDGCECGMDEEE